MSQFTLIKKGIYCVIVGIVLYGVYKKYHLMNDDDDDDIDDRLNKICDALIKGKQLKCNKITKGICCRIKCLRPNHLTNLSKPHKPYSFIMGDDGIYKLTQFKSDFDKLIYIGLSHKYIESQINKGYQYKIYLFPEKSKKK